MWNDDQYLRPFRAWQAVLGKFALRGVAFGAPEPGYILGEDMKRAQDICVCARMRLSDESLVPHCIGFAVETIESKQFSARVPARDVDIALSWGQGGNDHWQPCTARGRQEKWHKDLWPSQSLPLWRLSAFRAVKTVLRCTSLRTTLQHKRSLSAATFTSRLCFGRAFGPVRHSLGLDGVAHG